MCDPISCLCLACCGVCCCAWGVRRCCASSVAVSSSNEWRVATKEEFEDVPRVCRVVLGAYETDLDNRQFADKLLTGEYVKKTGYEDNEGMCPPYVIHVDHEAKDICLGIRGLNMASIPDYRVLMGQRKGFAMTKFDGGYVHHGLLRSAQWVLDKEFETLNKLAEEHPDYSVTFAGHSLGSGIVAMMTVLVCNDPDRTSITRDRLRCYAIAPARSTSMNLAIKYADVINSIILQDDFLPRTPAPIEEILAASFCLPCLLCWKCTTQTCIPESKRLKDPKRLYAPGRLYHVLYKKDFSCTNDEPIVKTAVEVKKRFEHIIFSRTTVDDHSIVVIEQKTTAAVNGMDLYAGDEEPETEAPKVQTMTRMETLRKQQLEEVAGAAEESQALGVPNAPDPLQFAQEAASISQRLESAEEQEKLPGNGAESGRAEDERPPQLETSGQQDEVLVVEDKEKVTPSESGTMQQDEKKAANRWHAAVKKVQQEKEQDRGSGSKWAALLAAFSDPEEANSADLRESESSQGGEARFRKMLSLNLTGAP